MAHRSRKRSAATRPSTSANDSPQHIPIARLTARGLPGLVVGWALVLGGALCLAIQVVVGVGSTVGPHGVTFLAEPRLATAPGWLTVVVLFGPLVGFNLVYWSVPDRLRTRNMGAVLVVLVLEMLTVMAASYWYAGADLVPSALFDKHATTADTSIAVHFFLACVLSAAAVMFWLGGNSTFDRQRAEYFGRGRRATVTTSAVRLRTNLLFSLGFLLLLLLVLAPLIPSSHRDVYGDPRPVRPWPTLYRDDSYFVGALSFYAFALAVLWGLSTSFLVKKALYAGPWAAKATASRRKGRPSRTARFANRVQHAPFILGAVVAIAIVTIPDPDQYGYHFGTGKLVGVLVTLAVCAGLGVLCLAQVWKARDPRNTRLRLYRASVDVG